MNLPNKLIVLRTFTIPFIVILMYMDSPYAKLAAFVLFCFGAFTDFIDGKIARNRNQVSDFGKFWDPLSDKIMLNVILLAFVDMKLIPAWMIMISLVRDFSINETKQMAKANGITLGSEMSGKIKGAFQNLTIFLGLLFLYLEYPKVTELPLNILFVTMLISIIFMCYSMVIYFSKNKHFIFKGA
ncbi:MAG TPA: CDP-diacylglycerol--glycerol-3-phosphate 3-phosphatidyltransferase [archaeon]|nr:CDP-diacylglycerol--glycerol-3-phosphate 3-phosphatidyltransferase [archaeon]